MPTRVTERLKLETMELVPGRKETADEICSHLIKALIPIVNEAVKGKAAAKKSVWEVHKLIRPDFYKLSPSVARAMEIYRLMVKLSRVVNPIRGDRFLRVKSYVRLTEDKEWENFKVYNYAKKYLHSRVKQGFTLQSLAIDIFLEEISLEGFERMSRRSVERDLRTARLYHRKQERLGRQADLYMPLSSGESLPFYNYSEDWKRRKNYTDK